MSLKKKNLKKRRVRRVNIFEARQFTFTTIHCLIPRLADPFMHPTGNIYNTGRLIGACSTKNQLLAFAPCRPYEHQPGIYTSYINMLFIGTPDFNFFRQPPRVCSQLRLIQILKSHKTSSNSSGS